MNRKGKRNPSTNAEIFSSSNVCLLQFPQLKIVQKQQEKAELIKRNQVTLRIELLLFQKNTEIDPSPHIQLYA